MESLMHNDYRQQPITTDEECAQYRQYLTRLETMIAQQEDMVAQARTAHDDAQLASARTRLWRLLTMRQGVADALIAYERGKQKPQTV